MILNLFQLTKEASDHLVLMVKLPDILVTCVSLLFLFSSFLLLSLTLLMCQDYKVAVAVHTLGKQGEFKTASVITQLPHSLSP